MNISTIAGHGRTQVSNGIAVSNEDGKQLLALYVPLNDPEGVVVDPKSDDLYIADSGNHRICRVSSIDGTISIIAGNGTRGFNGDDQMAIHAQLNNPLGLAIHQNGLYFTDSGNHRIRKINTIIPPLRIPYHLLKYDRDIIQGTNIICFTPALDIYCPQLLNLIVSASTLQVDSSFNSNLFEIIQHLIDLIMYNQEDQEDWYEKYELVDVLFILGLIDNTNNEVYIKLTRKLVYKFIQLFNDENDPMTSCPILLEKTLLLREKFIMIENSLLDQMINYCLEQASELIKKSPFFVLIPIISSQIIQIATKLSIKEKLVISVKVSYDTNGMTLERLFNEKKSSDITIKIDGNEYFCHKSILSSTSIYYGALFNSGVEYQDLKDNVYQIQDTDEFDGKLQEIIIRYCYGIFDTNLITPLMIIPLFKCAQFHEISDLSDYCVERLVITCDNYCTLADDLFMTSDSNTLHEKFIEFGVKNAKTLLGNRETLENIPIQLRNEMTLRYFQQK